MAAPKRKLVPERTVPQTQAGPANNRNRLILLGMLILVVGLAGRLWLIDTSTRWGYFPDHCDNIGWGLCAEVQGLWKVYSITREQLPKVPGVIFDQNRRQFVSMEREIHLVPHYPPLCITLFWVQAKFLEAVASPLTANTFTARLVMASVPILFELGLAIATYLVANQLFGPRKGFIVAAVCWLFPPIVLDASLWGQVDVLILTPTVFLIWFCLRRAWIAAGICLGVAMLLKPQGVLLLPITVMAILILEEPSQQTTFRLLAGRAGKVAISALGAILILTLPWMLADGLAWFRRSYLMSYVEVFPYTTLNAFNFWYVDALRAESLGGFNTLDPRTSIFGLSKDLWGRIILVMVLLGLGGATWKRYRHATLGLLVFGALWLWSVFLFPTRVHERYIIYCAPLVLLLGPAFRRFWPAIIGLAIVGGAEMTSNIWVHARAGTFGPPWVTSIHAQLTDYYRQQTQLLPPDQQSSPPTYEDARQIAWKTYRDRRQHSEGMEILLVVVCILSYFWVVVVAYLFVPWNMKADRTSKYEKRRRRG